MSYHVEYIGAEHMPNAPYGAVYRFRVSIAHPEVDANIIEIRRPTNFTSIYHQNQYVRYMVDRIRWSFADFVTEEQIKSNIAYYDNLFVPLR